jgi:hypothetical protein
MTQNTKDALRTYAVPVVGGVLAAILAVAGFETKTAHSESLDDVRAEQSAIHTAQDNNHAREYARVVCELEALRKQDNRVCP